MNRNILLKFSVENTEYLNPQKRNRELEDEFETYDADWSYRFIDGVVGAGIILATAWALVIRLNPKL